jgi:hypothetical protein
MSSTSRRTFLRGIGGAALALPWMESLGAKTAAANISKRMAHFYVPIGVVRRGFFPGEADHIIPKGNLGDVRRSLGKQDPNYSVQNLRQLTPTMQPLEGMKDKINLITGMDRTFQPGTDVHAQCASCYLSSAEPYTVQGTAWPLTRTLDHLVADHVGTLTPFSSLEFSCNSHKDNKESIYFDNISWYGTGHLAPSIRDPRKIYRRLFSSQEINRFRDITDLVLEDAASLKKELGYSDGQKFAEYFDSIRAIETQMDRLEKLKKELAKVAFDEPGSHHGMSHNQTKMIDDLLKVDRFHMEQYVYLAEKMDQVVEADGSTLLDNTLFTYGSGLGDGSTHQYNDLPIIVAGGGERVKTGQHINMPEGTPLANLWLTQARLMGLKMDRFADSSGEIGALRGT